MTDTEKVTDDVLAKIRVLTMREGDRLGVVLPNDIPVEVARGLSYELRAQWPELKPVIFAGEVELVAIREQR